MQKIGNLPPDVIFEADELSHDDSLLQKLAELIFASASSSKFPS